MKIRSLFTFQGRLGRSSFWKIFAALFIAAQAFGFIQRGLGELSPFVLLMIPVMMACALSMFSILARRLHDLGRSGRWVILLALAASVVSLPVGLLVAAILRDDLLAKGAMQFSSFVFMGLIGVIPGQNAANRFGPAPNRDNSHDAHGAQTT